MQISPLSIPDVLLIALPRYEDPRGYLTECFNDRALAEAGIDIAFHQENQAWNAKKNTVRGLHFQTPPSAQAKLVRVVRGALLDVAVDLRQGSPTYGRAATAKLDDRNLHQMYIPRGFAHAYCTLEDDTVVQYRLSDYFVPELALGLQWDDPDIGIDWPVSASDAILSEKDRNQPSLADLPGYFSYDAES